MKLLGLAFFALLVPSIAAAQNSGIFVQAGALLDIRATPTAEGSQSLLGSLSYTWNDINGDRLWQPGEEGVLLSDSIRQRSDEPFAPGASAAIGVFLSPSISLRLESSFQGEHITTIESSDGLFEPTSSRQAASVTDITVAAGWHQGGQRRTTIAYLAGVVFRRSHDETTVTRSVRIIGLPPQIGLGSTPVTSTTLDQTFTRTSYSAGVMAGVDVTLAVSARVAIVPQVRMVAADGDWNVRPGIALRWKP